MILYFAIALIGVLLLAGSFLLGEVFDFLHADGLDGDVHPLSGKVIATAMTAFGATGMLTTTYDWTPLTSALTSAMVAVLMGALVWWMMTVIYRQTASTDFTMASLRGRIAEVTVNIPAGSVGEVLLPSNESTRHMIARSADGGAIPRGTTVRVVETMGSVILVEPVRTNTTAAEASTIAQIQAEK